MDTPMSTDADLELGKGVPRASSNSPRNRAVTPKTGIESELAIAAARSISSTEQLFAKAREIAAVIRLSPALLTFLYEHRRQRSLSQESWEKEVRTAAALELIMRNSSRANFLTNLPGLFDERAKAEVNQILHSSGAVLLLTWHGGFSTIKRRFFAQSVEDQATGIVLRKNDIVDDAGQSLFTCMRALQDGRPVLMAPDGPRGRQSCTLHVCGKICSAGEGAAYLAGSAYCNVAWFTVSLENDRFVPSIEAGPRRQRGDNLEAYKTRLYEFYSQKIEELVTGNPSNIVLKPRWSRILRTAIAAPTS
jgi:hypothetical protein